MLSYLKFWLKSTNQHGVHSPFVYHYLTEGIYSHKKQYPNVSKSLKWLLQTISYFQYTTIYCISSKYTDSLQEHFHINNCLLEQAECIVAAYDKKEEDHILQIMTKMNAKQMMCITFDQYSPDFIQLLNQDEQITLVLDFYYGCLISKRKEQLKENFFLRM